MIEPVRVPPEEVREKVSSGAAILVCAYEDEGKYKKMRLEGSISFTAFNEKAALLSKEQEIIFYCA